MSLHERFIVLKNASAFNIDRKNRAVCPLTGKPPVSSRCTGQLELRMLSNSADYACQDYCIAKFDDEKIRMYGGTSTYPTPQER